MFFTHLIFDISNLFHKCYHIEKKDLRKTIIKCIYLIDYYKTKFLNPEIGKMLFCFDNPQTSVENRRLFDPEYKRGRKKQDEEFYKAIEYLKLLLINSTDGNQVISLSFCESDDLVKPLLEKIDLNYSRVLLMSEDMDYSRCIQDNVYWYHNKVVYDKNIFKEQYGFYPTEQKVILYKVIRGDKSDFIEHGIPGIREVDLLKIVENYDNIFVFLAEYQKLDWLSDTIKTIIKENDLILKKNHQLIKFLEINDDKVLEENTITTFYNETMLMQLLNVLKIKPEEIKINFKKKRFNSQENKIEKSSDSFFEINDFDVV